MSIARRLAIGLPRLVVQLIHLTAVAIATLIYLPAGNSERRQGCAGASWSAKPAAASPR